MLIEAASLVRLLGKAGSHVILVGGLVPPLIATSPGAPHTGSADVDLCLSLAITTGETREYYRSIQEALEPHFDPKPGSGSRWVRKQHLGPGLIVDFLAPQIDDEMPLLDGTRVKPDPVAEANTGVQLRPFVIRAGEIIDMDAEQIPMLDFKNVYRGGALDSVTLRHAGIAALFAAKADALEDRSEDKDGYDVAWTVINFNPDPVEFARAIARRPAFRHEDFAPRIQVVRDSFATPDHVGPHGYANTLRLDPASEEAAQARNQAYLVVDQACEALVEELHQLWKAQAAG